MIEKEGGTVAGESSVEGHTACKEGKKIEEERKDQETASGKGIAKFQNPRMSELTQCHS